MRKQKQCFQIWNDYTLTWDPSNFSNITVIVLPRSAIYIPDIVIYNTYTHVIHLVSWEFLYRQSAEELLPDFKQFVRVSREEHVETPNYNRT